MGEYVHWRASRRRVNPHAAGRPVYNAIPFIEDVDRIKIVSNPLHAEKARAHLAERRRISP